MRVTLSEEELAVIYGLLSCVNTTRSEPDLDNLVKRFEKLNEKHYPGWDAIPHWNDNPYDYEHRTYDGIEIYQD